MKKILITVYFSVILAVVSCTDLTKTYDEPTIDTGQLLGIVRETVTNRPLAGVTVHIDNSVHLTAETDLSGYFFIPDLIPNTYSVCGTKDGYVQASLTVDIDPNRTSVVELYLVRIDTNLTGTIVWRRQQSPIHINQPFTVGASDTLLIEPGVMVYFENKIPLIIRGTLLSMGMPEDSVFLTSDDPNGYWGGIRFLNNQTTSILNYTSVTRGLEQILLIENSSPYIFRCNLNHSYTMCETGGMAVFCKGSSSPIIHNCYITGFSNFKACGVNCETPANPLLLCNNIIGHRSALDTCVCGGGFLDGNYLAVNIWTGDGIIRVSDTSLGDPVDETGDGLCTTSSSDTLGLFSNVDGVTRPKSRPN
ncbi:MAG: hypothetical protein EH225_06275 [Calditrichaeota bacterium]|nr:carboxypeptidase regulatory-like domain-containing protein [Calditrichota bacterium]RQW04026.1 MAG: hypothetical protein EH225_06275 [Calditrichota bacterium]